MTYSKTGLLTALLLMIGVALFGASAIANDDGETSTFWEDRAKAKKSTTPKQTNVPKKTTSKPSTQKKATTAKPATQKTKTPKATRSAAKRGPVETAPSGLPPAGETRFIKDQVIVRFRLSAQQSDMNKLVGRLGLGYIAGRTFRMAGLTMHRYQITDGKSVAEVISALELDGTVVSAQPVYVYEPAQDAQAKPGQYALTRLAVAPISSKQRGAGVRLAIIDSVVDVSHPEFVKANIALHDVSDVPDAAPDAHGTGITGVAVAGATLTGIAPHAEIIAIAAFAKANDGQTFGNSWTIATALDVAASEKAQVVNMSFAGPRDPLLEASINGAQKRGIVLIAAAGNDGPLAAALFPAGYASTIGVTAIDDADAVYADANQGAYVSLAAPGVNILTAAPGGAYSFISGTSLASAHVSALVALLLGADASLTHEKLSALLINTSSDLGDAGRDTVFGDGVPNAAAALEQIGQ